MAVPLLAKLALVATTLFITHHLVTRNQLKNMFIPSYHTTEGINERIMQLKHSCKRTLRVREILSEPAKMYMVDLPPVRVSKEMEEERASYSDNIDLNFYNPDDDDFDEDDPYPHYKYNKFLPFKVFLIFGIHARELISAEQGLHFTELLCGVSKYPSLGDLD